METKRFARRLHIMNTASIPREILLDVLQDTRHVAISTAQHRPALPSLNTGEHKVKRMLAVV